jgi:hypothetical protein
VGATRKKKKCMIHDFNVFLIAANKFRNRILLQAHRFLKRSKTPFLIMPVARAFEELSCSFMSILFDRFCFLTE